MKTKEKAEELVSIFMNCQSHTDEIYDAKESAIMCVIQMKQEARWYSDPKHKLDRLDFLSDVATEINKL